MKTIKRLTLGLLLGLTLVGCSTDEVEQQDCSIATIIQVYPAPLLQPEKQRILIANNCTSVEHEVWTYTYTNPSVGQQVPWR